MMVPTGLGYNVGSDPSYQNALISGKPFCIDASGAILMTSACPNEGWSPVNGATPAPPAACESAPGGCWSAFTPTPVATTPKPSGPCISLLNAQQVAASNTKYCYYPATCEWSIGTNCPQGGHTAPATATPATAVPTAAPSSSSSSSGVISTAATATPATADPATATASTVPSYSVPAVSVPYYPSSAPSAVPVAAPAATSSDIVSSDPITAATNVNGMDTGGSSTSTWLLIGGAALALWLFTGGKK
jgi:hypothetical protein